MQFIENSLTIKWIYSNLKRPSFGYFLILLGIFLLYMLPIYLRIIVNTSEDNLTIRALAWVIICIGAVSENLKSKSNRLFFNNAWQLLFIFSYSIVMILGIIDGVPVLRAIMMSMPFIWLILLPTIAFKGDNWPWLLAIIFSQAIIGSIFALYIFFGQGINSRGAIIEISGQTFIGGLVYMAPLLFLMLPFIKSNYLRLISILGEIVWLLYAFFIGNRYTFIILLPLQIVLLLIIIKRKFKLKILTQNIFKFILVIFIITSFVFTVVSDYAIEDFIAIIVDRYDSLVSRLLEQETIYETIRQNERWIENSAAMESMEGLDWILGKGFGASWSSMYFQDGQTRYMIHNTYLNTLFWGGSVLLLIVMYPFLTALIFFRKKISNISIAFAGYIILVYIRFPAFLLTMPNLPWLLFTLAFGLVLKENHINRHERLHRNHGYTR